jgi:hypothetical protein
MIFDGRWDNIVPISIAHYRSGHWEFDAPPELKRPIQQAGAAALAR